MSKNIATTFLAVVVNVFCFTQSSIAQPPVNTPSANANMVTEFKGALKSFQRGVMVVSRDDGAEVMIQPPDDPSRFVFVASAKPAFLQRGMLVRFKGTFNQAGVSLSPVKKVELFQPISGKVADTLANNTSPVCTPNNMTAINLRRPSQAAASWVPSPGWTHRVC